MKNNFCCKIISLILIVGIPFSGTVSAYADAPTEKIVFHVSVNGKDNNPGTEELPFATLARAAQVVSLTEHSGKSVEVLFHGGTYYFNSSVSMDGFDAGGSEEARVTYKAAGDGEVIFTCFKDIDVGKFTSVTDGEMAERFYPEVLPYIGEIDLAAQGFKKDEIDIFYDDNLKHGTWDPPKKLVLLLNDKEQTLAQWPNFGKLVAIEDVVAASGANQVFKYKDSNIDRWEKTDYAMVKGYMGTEFREEWNRIGEINKEERTIRLKYSPEFAIAAGRNWRVENLPEELDIPGEYYIDIDTMKLYFYPPYKISETDSLKLTSLKDIQINLTDTRYITFEGIHFTGFRVLARPNGVVYVKNSTGINFEKCTFSYNSAPVNVALQACKDSLVEACSFYNTGALGVSLYSGANTETMEYQNNRVENCHFYNTGHMNWQNTGSAVSSAVTSSYQQVTVGNVIKNNLIHHIYGNVSVMFRLGCDYDISYNEIANGVRTLADFGLIYVGGYPEAQGNKVAYNYFHDYGSLTDPSMAVNAIYFDDWTSGNTAENNFISSNWEGNIDSIFSVGAFNTIRYNTIANGAVAVMQGDRKTGVANSTVASNRDKPPAMSQAWKNKYPHMLTLSDALKEDGSIFPVMNNLITDNIAVNSKHEIAQTAIDMGTVENNYEYEEDNGIFVDAENHDFRIKSDFAISEGFNENLSTEDNFSMDKIGIQKDVWDIKNPKASFRKIYPANGANTISAKNVVISWEQALFADRYEYVVATDPEFENVVKSGISYWEYAELGDLDPGRSYYWKVTAENITKQLGGKWESEGVPYMFTTLGFTEPDKKILKENIVKAEPVFSVVTEGNGEIGDYKEGTPQRLSELMEDAKYVYNSFASEQDEVDDMSDRLEKAMLGLDAYKYVGYKTIEASDAAMWKSSNENTTVSVEGNTTTLTGGNTVAYEEQFGKCYVLQFKMNANLDNGWVGYTLRQNDPDKFVWNGTKYLICVKKDLFEFQKYKPGAPKTGILMTKENNGIVNSNEWHNVEFGAVDVEGGVYVTFKVDDELVFEFLDTESPIYTDGSFCIKPPDGSMLLAPADSITEGFYEAPEYIYQSKDETDEASQALEGISAFKIGEGYCLTDGEKVEIPGASPELINDKTYLPLRFIAELFGFTVEWIDETSEIKVYNDEKSILFKEGDTAVLVNDEQNNLEAPPIVLNSRTLIPLRDLSELLSKDVIWNGDTQIVIVAEKTEISQENGDIFEIIDEQFGGEGNDF